MKKRFSIMAVALMAGVMVSCQSNTKTPEDSVTDTTTTAAVSTSADTSAAKGQMAPTGNGAEILNVSPDVKVDVPQFSSEDVNNGFAKFEPMRQAYKQAIEQKDAAKIKELTTTFNAWAKEAATWGNKLTKDENQVYIDYYTKLVTQWEKLSKKVKK